MSATEKLLSNIQEYHNLLGFLNEKHPKILEEWKARGPNSPSTNDDDPTITPEPTRNDSQEIIR